MALVLGVIARSSLALAEGRLEASEENYRRVIGNLPPDLQPPPPLPTLPRDADLAMEVALANNADLAAIAARARAAGYDVSVARGGRLPTISIGSGTRYLNRLGTGDEVEWIVRETAPAAATARGAAPRAAAAPRSPSLSTAAGGCRARSRSGSRAAAPRARARAGAAGAGAWG